MNKSAPMASSFEGFLVIGLVGLVLAAVLSPVYASAKAAARTSRCAGNLRFLAQNMSLYTADHDGFMDARDWSYRLVPGTEHLSGYDEVADRFTCLDSPGVAFSYAMNGALSGKRSSALPKPETQLLFFDSKLLMPNVSGDKNLLPDPPRHGGVNMAVYVDGHVSGLRRDAEQ